MHTPWERYQKDVFELLDQRLRRCGANVLWRAYGPTHFGTDLGAFTGAPAYIPSQALQWQPYGMPKALGRPANDASRDMQPACREAPGS